MIEGLIEGFDDKYKWYMILGNKDDDIPSYIGMAYAQSVSDRLLGNHEGFKQIIREVGKDTKINLALGYPANPKNPNKKAIMAIESVMIGKYKPEYNASGIRGYKGTKIKIISKQVKYLIESYDVLKFELIAGK